MELSEIEEALKETSPEKIIVDIDDYELDKQAYRFLYENLKNSYDELLNEYNSLQVDKQNLDRDIADASATIDRQNIEISKLKENFFSDMEYLKEYICKDVYVADINASNVSNDNFDKNVEKVITPSSDALKETISMMPGVLSGKRPSFFMTLNSNTSNVLTKEAVQAKNVKNTFSWLKERFNFQKNLNNKKISDDKAADEYDTARFNNIKELLASKCSNQEKYIKYILLSQGFDNDILDMLDKASKLNLNANLVISLLEQKKEYFNKEIIRLYISQVYDSTEYNLKQELAKELIEGQWVIFANMNGKKELFQLVPINELRMFDNKLTAVLNQLNENSVCADSAQTVSQIDSNNEVPEYMDNIINDDLIDEHLHNDVYIDSDNQIIL